MKALMSGSPRKPGPSTSSRRRDSYPWSVPVRFEDVPPETGRQVTLSPDAHAREAIAAVIGLRELRRLDASFDVVRSGAAGLHVTGTLSATVGQTCVVTLEPIESEINEAVDLVFKPAADNGASADIGLDMDQPEIELLIDGVVDLGALATEFLILGIDPYPRKPGAVFEAPPAGEPFAGPFAGLAALQKKPQK
jgi:Large ribosomal RNA subunit accumulation protein YceD